MAWPAMSIAEAHARLTAPGSPFEMEEIEVGGRRLKSWKHQPPTNAAVLTAARAFGERDFLVYEDERVSFEALHRAVANLAQACIDRGLKKGDRVAIVMRNLPEWVVAFYAASVCGAIVAPLNAWWTGPELVFGLADCGACFVVLDPERRDRLQGLLGDCPDLERVFVVRAPANADARPPEERLEDLIGPPAAWAALPDVPLPDVALEPDDPATLFYTSGTTAGPKGALATHRNMLTNIVGGAFAAARIFLRRGEPIPAPDPDAPQQAALLTVPFFHATGCFAILSPSLAAGRKLVLIRRWEPETAMALIEREQVTAITCVPAIAWQLLEHPARQRYDLSSLKALGYGGASAPPELARRIESDLPDAMAGHGWGMTETSALATTHSAEDYLNRPASCGPSLPVGEIRIVDPATLQPLAAGQVGELWFRGPQVVQGYWNRPEATAATFVDGWVRSGDLARVDEEGFLFIVDRLKDIVIRGGENIYCVEVENVLYEHPAVMDAAVVGRAHPVLGEEPVAFVTLAPGAEASEAELRAFAAERLPAYAVPVQILIDPDPLPRNANGKILKTELKARVGEAAAA